jgi:serine protease inhibitor
VLSASVASTDLSQKLSKSHFEFSLRLYHELVRDSGGSDGGNLVFSPFSVNSVLSMLFLGTSSSSSSSLQIRSVLGYNNISYVDVHNAYNAFKAIANNFDDKYYDKKVRNANGLFVQEGIAISAPYDRALREFYHSSIESMDFRNADARETMGAINDWVSDVTDGQIPQLLDMPPDKDAKMVLVNALSMQGKWLYPFDPNDTFDKGLFFPAKRSTVSRPFSLLSSSDDRASLG